MCAPLKGKLNLIFYIILQWILTLELVVTCWQDVQFQPRNDQKFKKRVIASLQKYDPVAKNVTKFLKIVTQFIENVSQFPKNVT